MARFPIAEAEIITLAQAMASGLADNAAVYPAPPVAPADLTALISEATLVEQPRGKELEYRIIAVNKAGDGEPSNTAMVVL